MTLTFDQENTTHTELLNEFADDLVYLLFGINSETLWMLIQNDGPFPPFVQKETIARWCIDELDADQTTLMMIDLCRDAAWNRYATAVEEIDRETDFIVQNARKYVADKLYLDAHEIADALYQAVCVAPGLNGREVAAGTIEDFEIRYGSLLRHLAARPRNAREHD